MRGLIREDTGPGGVPSRDTARTAGTTVAALVSLVLLGSACGNGGTGIRDEGPARTGPAAKPAVTVSPRPAAPAAPRPSAPNSPAPSVTAGPGAPPSPSPAVRAGRVDAVRLVQRDPQVSAVVKRALKPCAADEYPVDVAYGDLTGSTADDIVVNVLSCEDAVGLGAYVYREQGGGYENVFKAEEPPVHAEIDCGALVVTRQVYTKDDRLSSPSGEDVITYRWSSGDRFTEEYRTHRTYDEAAGK
ncbi:hypothetical protein [Streptomyces sp. F-3]|uniref:hypothetical protein n=1 Tax=Streptomyces sp. F-3 TaxID=1840095 RepID=UPI000830BBD8|nr:hypothetical protein [Streptomyces sp. F-3]